MKQTYTGKREFSSYAQRSVVKSPRGMVASSHNLASVAGYNILRKGGNAVDAAVAMVSVLNVVEPHSVGLGGDAFALIHMNDENKLYGLNGSGRAPRRATIEEYVSRGLKSTPARGLLSVTVPGAPHAWAEAVRRFGRLTLSEVFEDAIYYAEHGFPVTEVIAGEWKAAESVLKASPDAAAAYLINGAAPRAGQVFRNPDLASSYRAIAEGGVDVFYRGELARKIVAYSEAHGGLLSMEDFETHSSSWVDPISFGYKGYDVVELPPNGQGVTALEMLNILSGFDLKSMGHNSPDYLHSVIEAKKIAFADRDYYVTDPEFEDVPVKALLSPEYGRTCRAAISPGKAMTPPDPPLLKAGSDTVYVTAVDENRNAVSFISSIFMSFGSGVVVDGAGIALQNRGSSFSLDPAHPNRLQPGKRPMHTIIPGMVFRDGRFLMCFGVMGGEMQPQGHVQFLLNLLEFDMNVQEAMDAPRVRHLEGMEVFVEDGVSGETVSRLRDKGHVILHGQSAINMVGGGQAIYVDRDQDVLFAASDRRKDGCAIGY